MSPIRFPFTPLGNPPALDPRSAWSEDGRVIWLTGLSGAGKSTLSAALHLRLVGAGVRGAQLDGDALREGLNSDLGFSDADRSENIRRVAEVAKLMADAGLIVLVSLISPFAADRERARKIIGERRFFEVFLDTPFDVCAQRDVKGLYAKAMRGEIPSFTGVGSRYEPPATPDMRITWDGRSPDDHAADVARRLKL